MKEWSESKLDEELKDLLNAIPKQDDFEKQIETFIRKKIRKIVLRTLAVVLIVVVILLLVINPLMNYFYLNPYKLNAENPSVLINVMRDYWETMEAYTEIVGINVEKKGFGRYDVDIQVYNQREKLYFGKSNVKCSVNFGNFEDIQDPNGYLNHVLGRFQCDWNHKEEIISDLKELPGSARIYLSIGTDSAKDIVELMQENIQVNWIEIYQPNVEFQGGLNMSLSSCVNEDDCRDEMSAAELKEVYLSNLENLLENTDVWESFGIKSGGTIYMNDDVLNETYEDAKKMDTVQTKNYCISGKRDVVIEYLDKTDIHSILIDEIALY